MLFSDPRNVGEFGKSRESGRRPSSEDRNVAKRKPNAPTETIEKENKNQQIIRKHEGAPRPINNKPSNNNVASGPGRPPRVSVEPKSNGSDLHKRPVSHPPQNVRTIEIAFIFIFLNNRCFRSLLIGFWISIRNRKSLMMKRSKTNLKPQRGNFKRDINKPKTVSLSSSPYFLFLFSRDKR